MDKLTVKELNQHLLGADTPILHIVLLIVITSMCFLIAYGVAKMIKEERGFYKPEHWEFYTYAFLCTGLVAVAVGIYMILRYGIQ